MKCIIMRGASGTGKDHYIKRNLLGMHTKVISADSYFMINGEYVFNKDQLPDAHNYCLRQFVYEIFHGTNEIVINNTNTRLFEIAPYYRLAEAFNYDVEIIWIVATLEECIRRNVHDTPPDVIKQMIQCADSLPPWWNVKLVTN